MLAEYNEAKRQKAEAEERFDKIENELAQAMLVEQIKSDLVDVSGDVYKVTVIAKETPRIDEAGLREFMGAVKYRKVCKPPRADVKLIEAAIRSDVLSAETAARFVTYTTGKPYLRVTPYTEGEE